MDIRIRHAEPVDAEAIQKIYATPNAYTGTLQLPYPSVEMWRKRLTAAPDGLITLVAAINEEVVGSLGLLTKPSTPRTRHIGHIGMGVRDDQQGRGAGNALVKAAVDMADNWLNLIRLELSVYTDNERAISLYKKYGFEVEGEMQAYAFRNGEYVNAYMMARLTSD